jgi:hypothetical protein
MKFYFSAVSIVFATLLATACTPEEEGSTPDTNFPDSGLDAIDATLADMTDEPDTGECDRFCVWDNYLRDTTSEVFTNCICKPHYPESYTIEQQDIDICASNEARFADLTVNDVERDCLEAMSDSLLAELVDYTECVVARNAVVETCLRGLMVGDLCSTCEPYLANEGADPCLSPRLNDAISACVDGRPGF